MELSECVEVRLAEEETGHAHSLALVTAVSHTTYIKGASRDEIARCAHLTCNFILRHYIALSTAVCIICSW